MSENQKKILEMLAENKINADEAYRLLSLVDDEGGQGKVAASADNGSKGKGKYLRVTVLPDPEAEKSGDYDRVNVRVPMSLIRAGIKLTSLIPHEAAGKVNTALRDKGIDFDLRSLKAEDLEQLIEALGDMEVDVQTGKEKVRVFVE